MKPEYIVGDRIEARCTRCCDVTGHVITVILDDKIFKVQCCACGSHHKYHPPKQKSASPATPAVRRVRPGDERKQVLASARNSEAAAHAGTRRTRQAKEIEERWRTALERPSAPEARPYTIDIHLTIGDIINHPVFGLGTVEALSKPDKAHLLFQDGSRILRCVCRIK